ncbi:proline and serine-rich protein 2-like [Sinocyclocheilus rhinocerous]|uniref:Proline and serine-rich protein 2-like n=1 Tax=Sinocyclocheilus rhinocerous TaxID=307959 RepID=A0A673N915_9TELE|nr:PREDICTED: proline and serine-rich protein 2-like [Sinocyclocheilus rhinocerous]
MDVHMHNGQTLHYGLNDAPDDDLQFLSLEERECILFFEETIGSLEEDDERTGISAGNHRLAVERPLSYTTARHPSPVDHDIIDLVHPTPDASKQKDTLPVMPDFQQLIIPPETHFEVKPKRDLDVSDGPQFGHQPPAGSVPTPVVIASKIAEHQGAGGTSASQLLQRRRSLESPPNPSTKHGPPTHAKPTRFPDKISMLLGSREHIPHSIAAEAVSVQERRAQMLSSLSGTAHPLDGGEPACVRNLPIRSISFRDPTPDKSRMEALSKLGLAQRRTQSVMHSSNFSTTLNITNPANTTTDADTTDHCQTKSSPAPTLTSAEVTHSDFNSYGGKSIMLNPTLSFRTEYRSSSVPKTESSDVRLNNFGSRSRVVTPSHPKHGTQTKTITPVKEDNSSSNRTSNEGLPKRKASHSEAPVKQLPAPAPKPRSAPLSPELRRKSLPKPSFRTQGITVQFSGRGATDEARRDALRKLGLLRNTP